MKVRVLLAGAVAVGLVALLVVPSRRDGSLAGGVERSGSRSADLTDLDDFLLPAVGSRLLAAEAERAARAAPVQPEGGTLAPEDLQWLFAAAREAIEAGRYAEGGELISRALVEASALETYVDGLLDPALPPEQRETVLWALELLMHVERGAREAEVDGVPSPARRMVHAIFQRVLVRLGALSREDALTILRSFARNQVLGEEHLDLLAGWLPHLEYCEPLAKLVALLALSCSPPRYELLMELIHGGDTDVGATVAEGLAQSDPDLAVALAFDLARELPPRSDARQRMRRLIALHAEPDTAFDFLAEEASTIYWVDLMAMAVTLSHRDVHEQAFERYLTEPDPERRRLLLSAGWQDVGFLEHALDHDEDAMARSDALLKLINRRPDAATGERLAAALTDLTHAPPGRSGRGTLPPVALLVSIEQYARSSAADPDARRVLARIRQALEGFAGDPGLDEVTRELALETLGVLGPP